MTDGRLSVLCAETWADLEQSLTIRTAPLRTPTLATIAGDGRPTARIVVLRAVAAEHVRLVAHTDARSAKAEEIAVDSRASLVFWDPDRRRQFRFEGTASVVGYGEDVDTAWAATPPSARWSYGGTPAPGASLATPDDWRPPVDDAAARTAFRVISFAARRLDWLELGAERHRRAEFLWDEDGVESGARWLSP